MNPMHELDVREENELDQALMRSQEFVEKNYLSRLSDYEIIPVPEQISQLTARDHFRIFHVNKLVYDKNENLLDKLTSVYSAIGDMGSSILLLLHSDGAQTNLYVGVKATHPKSHASSAKEALEKSFEGHFPGSELLPLRNQQLETMLEQMVKTPDSRNHKVISSVSGIPSLKDEDKTKFVQGLEKFIDAMKGEAYSAFFIADPVSHRDLLNIRQGYETLYSAMLPFAKSTVTLSANDTQSVTEGISKGMTHTINESLAQTQSHTSGTAVTNSESLNKSTSANGGFSFILSAGRTHSTSRSNSSSEAVNSSSSEGSSSTRGTSDAESSTENLSDTVTTGRGRTLQLQMENKALGGLLEKIDQQLERMKSSEDFGMWNCACYFLSDNIQTSKVAASTYKGIMRGEQSAIENSYINTWDYADTRSVEELAGYLKKLSHPYFNIEANVGLSLPHVTPGSMLSGKELAIQLGLPRKSVSGLPVLETAEFGRDVITHDTGAGERATLPLGQIFHMGRMESTPVRIDVNSLTMHTFVTGSTGSGKSNTIYALLSELYQKKIPFLVIEPAKGEYKEVFGGRDDVHVFGTNPAVTPIFKLNPFRFPEQIHVLEHIDRLVDIFNACWPLYAAMPAILKDAIEQTYEDIGWDLELSENMLHPDRYPSVQDLLRVLPKVIEDSAYAAELKSNYTGALVTRVKSLSNGLIGKLFSDQETDNGQLFTGNCIIDLSRIGSAETKSLLMGILFMRLQEDRMSKPLAMNSELRHVTVLEEAHHLLRRTSMEQSSEGSNVRGKSIEMITNAIAEMRTFGEGFIIADQAPNMLDNSVIRNTNTKIILRLPDGSDREEVGRAAALNEDQMNEIPKLKTGVAVVYQNNWLQPVLCQIQEFDRSLAKSYHYSADPHAELAKERQMKGNLLMLLLSQRVSEGRRVDLQQIDPEPLLGWLHQSGMDEKARWQLENNIRHYRDAGEMELWREERFDDLSKIVYHLSGGAKAIKAIREAKDLRHCSELMCHFLRRYANLQQIVEYEQAVVQCLFYEKSRQDEGFKDFYFAWVEHERKESGAWL
ncbi:DUF87 domain-containing protein [Paenibacillus oryzisoli]|uniref:ATP-binding protein n=1 Tax=Paenibacillus oryzisoli TaxID=1850517 RepID=UPI003D2BFE76